MTKLRGDSSSPPLVQSVARALGLLEAVAAREEIGLADLSRETELQPSTVHRLLATLTACGYVVQSTRNGRYRVSHKVVALAGAPELRVARLRSTSHPHLDAIRDYSDETTNLVVLERFTATYVDQAESPRAVRMFTTIGRRVPAHATGGGKALLAFQPDAVHAALLATAPCESLTVNTITSASAIREELDRIRARGYATEREEYEMGVGCFGVPVLDDDGHAIAAISVSAPLVRLEQLDMVELVDLITSRTNQIARDLGYQGSAAVSRPAA